MYLIHFSSKNLFDFSAGVDLRWRVCHSPIQDRVIAPYGGGAGEKRDWS